MQRWVKQNLSILITIVTMISSGIAYAAVLNSDVERLKREIPERLLRLEEKTDEIQKSVNRIEGYLAQ